MSSTQNTNREYFDAVAERLRGLLSVKTDAELAEVLGMKPNAYANRKKSGSIPYDEIVTVMNVRGVSLDAVFRPEDSQYVSSDSPTATSIGESYRPYMSGAEHDPKRLAIEVGVLLVCQAACAQVHGPEFEKLPASAQMEYAADLYNLSVKISEQSGGIDNMKRLDKDGMQKLLEVFMRLNWARRFPPAPPSVFF